MKIRRQRTLIDIDLVIDDGPTFTYTTDTGVTQNLRVRRMAIRWADTELIGATISGPAMRDDGSEISWQNLKYTITNPAERPDWLIKLMDDGGWPWEF